MMEGGLLVVVVVVVASVDSDHSFLLVCLVVFV